MLAMSSTHLINQPQFSKGAEEGQCNHLQHNGQHRRSVEGSAAHLQMHHAEQAEGHTFS
jgi:hypothetical protein